MFVLLVVTSLYEYYNIYYKIAFIGFCFPSVIVFYDI